MQIIEEIEPHRRGVYCGAIGYVGYDGNMDTNIAIRTLVHSHGTVRFWAGGGIVADSQRDAEYQETFDKCGGVAQPAATEFRGAAGGLVFAARASQCNRQHVDSLRAFSLACLCRRPRMPVFLKIIG